MTLTLKAGLAVTALAFAVSLAPASAADLGGARQRGSIKDHGYEPAPVASPVGPCYFRADVGYSWSQDPELRWTATGDNGLVSTDRVSRPSFDGSWLGEAGLGCGSGSRGLRAEVMLGYRGERQVSGITGFYANDVDPATPLVSSRIVSAITTYTAMVNVYKDLGRWGSFTPYIGAGIGLAYHQMDDYWFPGALPAIDYRVSGDNDLTFAWSLMAGAGYQITDRAIFDFGYRYIDLGSAASGRHDNYGNGRVSRFAANDLAAHEFKVGLRYHFSPAGGECCAVARPVPLK